MGLIGARRALEWEWALLGAVATLLVLGGSALGANMLREPAPTLPTAAVGAQWSVSVAAHAGQEGASTSVEATPASRTLRSQNGLLVAHYGVGFVARSERSEHDAWTTITITRTEGGDDAVTLRSIASTTTNDDVASSALDAAIDAWERGGMRFEETSRSEGTCLGGRATVLEGRLQRAGRRLQGWSCAFVNAGHGFVLGYRLEEEGASTVQEARTSQLRGILDATVLAPSSPNENREHDIQPVVTVPSVAVVPPVVGYYPYYSGYVAQYAVVAPVAATKPSTMILHAAARPGHKAIDIDVLCDAQGACQRRPPTQR
jgi:hypothetical protein